MKGRLIWEHRNAWRAHKYHCTAVQSPQMSTGAVASSQYRSMQPHWGLPNLNLCPKKDTLLSGNSRFMQAQMDSAEISQFTLDADVQLWGFQNTREKPRWKWNKCKLHFIETGNRKPLHVQWEAQTLGFCLFWTINPIRLGEPSSRVGGTEGPKSSSRCAAPQTTPLHT